MIYTETDTKRFELQAEVIQAFAHPLRLAIVNFLADGEQCVCDIADAIGSQRSNVSRHLSLMHKSGVISQRKDGLKMIYALQTPCVLNFLGCINNILHRRLADQNAALMPVAADGITDAEIPNGAGNE